MKYIDEYRDSKLCEKLASQIAKIAKGKYITLMEVCGTHTMSIARYGIKNLLPPNIQLLSGPGCPVCVTADADIDKAIAYAEKENIILTTFGDMMKVPGTFSSLSTEKSKGREIKVVYSAADALQLAISNPEKIVVFLGVGFETTIPTVAVSILDAKMNGIKNYYVLSMHKLIPPALRALLDDKEVCVDGFILPGHVSTIIGVEAYKVIPEEYGVACAITGFEPVDILQGILLLVKQIVCGKPRVENQYRRVVKEHGNPKAQRLIEEVFEPTDCEWRGLGVIPRSGLKIKDKYSDFDIEKKIKIKIQKRKKNTRCICGEILRGVKTPLDCTLFGKRCTPENPVGPCMVSSEGTCAAYYKYGFNSRAMQEEKL